MTILPTLYKKTNTGAIQQWEISVEGSTTITKHGQVGGVIQMTTDLIKEGKGLGTVKATTPEQQALKEAEAKWTKQLKKGYVKTLEDAQAGKVDDIIEGGVAPMLAPNKIYPQDANLAKKIVFPAFVQPKLDGMRCIATIIDGKASLWSRTRKPIKTCPHIIADLETMFPGQTLTLDGELYNHSYRNNFEDLLSVLRKDEPDAEGLYKNAQLHLYDIVNSDTYSNRKFELQQLIKTDVGSLTVVRTYVVNSTDEALALQEKFEVEEYEGAMIRNAHGPYESGKRSSHLQKMKTWVDSEFKIIGMEEGRGKDTGTVGAFVLVTAEGLEFRSRLKASYARRRELFSGPESAWKGKMATVRYKRLTNGGLPYCNRVVAIDDDK